MKTTIATAASILIFIITIRYLWTHRSNEPTPTPSTQTQTATPTPTPSPTPEKAIETHPTIHGWMFTEIKSGYEWYIPVNRVNENPTEWFGMADLNTQYRVKKTCVVELKAKTDGSITTFLVNTATDTRHISLGNGDFSPDLWSEAEFQKVSMAAQAIRFKPYDKGPLEVRMGRTE